MKTHCADVSLPRKFQPSVYYMNRVQSPTCSKAPMGQIARVETLPLSLTSRAAQPTRPPSLIHRGDRPRTAGNFSLLFFSLFSLFYSSSFLFVVSFLAFLLSFFSLARLDVSVLFGAQQGARATLAIYIYISFLEEEERKYFPTSERILERSSKCGGERVEGEGGEGQVSARNRSLTAVLHELPLSISLSLYLFFPSRPRPMVIAMPRRATPRDARRSYGPPGVPGHSSGNRSASVARGTR